MGFQIGKWQSDVSANIGFPPGLERMISRKVALLTPGCRSEHSWASGADWRGTPLGVHCAQEMSGKGSGGTQGVIPHALQRETVSNRMESLL